MTEHKATLRARMASGQAADPKAQLPERYEILFIGVGEANGYSFSEQVLRDSASQWEDCSVFVDHTLWGMPSVRNLGGVLSNIAFNPEHHGLTAELKCTGPAAEIVRMAAHEMLADAPHPDLGFSADVILRLDTQNNVEQIVQPLSVDLVVDPAFATKFIRQLNSKGVPMAEPTPSPKADDTAAPEKPENIQALFQEIDALKKQVKDLQGGQAAEEIKPEIKGPARASAMFDSRDQIQAAMDDLVGAPREQGAEALKVAKFSGIRDAYVALTGDRDFVGGYFPDRIQFTRTAANFPALVANALNKALANHWQQLGAAGYDWWKKIATVEHFNSLQDITWMLFGTIGSLPTVAENGEYTELVIGDSKETSSFVKKGGYVGLSLEAMDKDDTRKLRAIPRELALAGLREISATVAAIFTQAAGAGPTLSDTGALFNATAVTTKGGHKNLLTTALGTDFTAWDAVSTAMYSQPMLIAAEDGSWGLGKACAIEPRYFLVPRALKAAAEALFIPRWASTIEAAIAAKGGPTYGGYVEPITVPEWTDATDWAAVADPAIMPGIMIGERFGLLPQVFVAGSELDPAMFSNDESRVKVRHLIAVGVADFRPLHKSNVA